MINRDGEPACDDCGLLYCNFQMDTVLSNDQWVLISNRTDGGGLLCANCIVRRGAMIKGKPFVRAKLIFQEE